MKILFVCLGNICRSPSAENVMRHLLVEEGLETAIELDSAGTIGYHAGNRPDSRMTVAAQRRGIEMTGHARKVEVEDFEEFDLILAMDRSNFQDLRNLRRNDGARATLKLFCDFCTEHSEKEVPDPYYGGPQGFELVLDLLEDGCAEILRQYRTGELNS